MAAGRKFVQSEREIFAAIAVAGDAPNAFVANAHPAVDMLGIVAIVGADGGETQTGENGRDQKNKLKRSISHLKPVFTFAEGRKTANFCKVILTKYNARRFLKDAEFETNLPVDIDEFLMDRVRACADSLFGSSDAGRKSAG